MTPGHREQADVGITGGRIAQLGGTMTGAGEIDASRLLVIPGGIDAHVHLMYAQFTAWSATGPVDSWHHVALYWLSHTAQKVWRPSACSS